MEMPFSLKSVTNKGFLGYSKGKIAYGYVRSATESQDTISFLDQIDRLAVIARQKDLCIPAENIYSDSSGGDKIGEGLQSLLDTLSALPADQQILVVAAPDRLARDAKLERDIRKQVACVEDGEGVLMVASLTLNLLEQANALRRMRIGKRLARERRLQQAKEGQG